MEDADVPEKSIAWLVFDNIGLMAQCEASEELKYHLPVYVVRP